MGSNRRTMQGERAGGVGIHGEGGKRGFYRLAAGEVVGQVWQGSSRNFMGGEANKNRIIGRKAGAGERRIGAQMVGRTR